MKVHVGGNEVHTGQLFFPDSQAGAGKAVLHLRRRSGGKGYVGSLTTVVTPS